MEETGNEVRETVVDFSRGTPSVKCPYCKDVFFGWVLKGGKDQGEIISCDKCGKLMKLV